MGVEGDGLVRIACRRCGEPCLLNHAIQVWFHEEDYLTLNSLTSQKYDHQPQLVIIDINPTEEDSPTTDLHPSPIRGSFVRPNQSRKQESK